MFKKIIWGLLWGRRDGVDVRCIKMNHDVNIHPLVRHAYCERENFLGRVLDFQKKSLHAQDFLMKCNVNGSLATSTVD